MTAKAFTILVRGDNLNEQDERIHVLAAPQSTNATLDDSSGYVTIRDDDRPVVVDPGIPAVSLTEGNRGTNPVMNFTVRLDRAPVQQASLVYETRLYGGANPATPGVDYVEKTGVLYFAPGQTTAVIPIQTIGDNVPEATERVLVRLTTPINLSFPGTIEGGLPGMFLHGNLVDND